jgi:Tol biopolymer transport system component
MPALSTSLPLRVTTVCAVTAALGVTGPTADAHAADPPTTTRVSVSTGGTQADGASTSPQLSANGRFVAFLSNASNLVSGDTNGFYDVFLHDRNTGRTDLVSRGLGGAAANDASRPPRVSANGRYVVFHSSATNLVADDTNRAP